MLDYASLTVAQLKEQLKAKSLPTDGKKADLVARLTDAEASNGNELDDGEDEATEPATAADEVAAPAEAAGEAEPAVDAVEAAEPVEESVKEEEPKKKVLTPEERKQLAVDLLTKKLKRAEKFGDEALAQEARSNLARVEKFGVDPGTALAKEIGAVDRSINSELKTQKFRRGVSKNKKAKKSAK